MSGSANKSLCALLATFAPGMVLFVPDDLLALWFPPGPQAGALAPPLIREAKSIALAANCSFEYIAGRNAACFTKLARC